MDLQAQQGLMSTHREGWRSRSPVAMLMSAALVGFYTLLYWGGGEIPYLGLGVPDLFGWTEGTFIKNRWYVYGALYCVAMVAGGIYYLRRHGNSRYNRWRIFTNLFVQIGFAFSLPYVTEVFLKKDYYLSYLWPLDYDAFYRYNVVDAPVLGVIYAFVGAFLIAPMLAFLFGKRWYCSWVCGCGGLANTFGDPWRHLTSNTTKSWRFEQVSIHLVLAFAIINTGVVVFNWAAGQNYPAFSEAAYGIQKFYGFAVGAVLAGVIGTGLYPVLGPRVWCRNFCPMAALLGLQQKLGRFRIRVKDDMCISCGNCSAYCEMGIDVRAYAQSNQSFTRASCVGCGMCAHVCPRGVLRLENNTRHNGDKARQHLVVLDL